MRSNSSSSTCCAQWVTAAYARSIQTTIVLVDGAQLAELMIDHSVGVATYKRYDIRRLDSDYFAAE